MKLANWSTYYLIFGRMYSNVHSMVLLNSVNKLCTFRCILFTHACTACESVGQTCEATTEFLVSWPRTKVNTEYRSGSTIRTLIISTEKEYFEWIHLHRLFTHLLHRISATFFIGASAMAATRGQCGEGATSELAAEQTIQDAGLQSIRQSS